MRPAAILLLAVLPFASEAFAASAPPAPPAHPPVAAPQPLTPAQACAKQAETRAMRLDQLGALLKLTAGQKPQFDTWRKIRLDAAASLPCPPMPTGMSAPSPQRMANQITMMTATLEALKKVQPATETFYNALTPDQRKVFDAPMRMMMQIDVPPGGPKNGKLTVKPAGPGAATPPQKQ